MPVVNFEGVKHTFPDDFTEQEISKALSSLGDNKPQEIPDTPEMLEAEAATMGGVENARAHTVGFSDAVAFTLSNEIFGKTTYYSDPDTGEESNFGISKKSYPDEDIKNMTQERATAIYRRDFWDKPRLGQLPDRLATKVFDMGVNAGNTRGVKLLQAQLGTTITGVVNDATVKAVEAQDEEEVITGYVKTIKEYYKQASKKGKNAKHLGNWLRRADKLPEVADEESAEE